MELLALKIQARTNFLFMGGTKAVLQLGYDTAGQQKLLRITCSLPTRIGMATLVSYAE